MNPWLTIWRWWMRWSSETRIGQQLLSGPWPMNPSLDFQRLNFILSKYCFMRGYTFVKAWLHHFSIRFDFKTRSFYVNWCINILLLAICTVRYIVFYFFLFIYHRTIAQHVKAKDPTRLVTFVANADYKEEQAVDYYFFLTVNFILYNTCTNGIYVH